MSRPETLRARPALPNSFGAPTRPRDDGAGGTRLSELHQVDCGKRAAWELLHLPAGLKVAEIDGGKSQLPDQVSNHRLRIRIQTRHEHHTMPARLARIAREDRGGQSVERLDHASSG